MYIFSGILYFIAFPSLTANTMSLIISVFTSCFDLNLSRCCTISSGGMFLIRNFAFSIASSSAGFLPSMPSAFAILCSFLGVYICSVVWWSQLYIFEVAGYWFIHCVRG